MKKMINKFNNLLKIQQMRFLIVGGLNTIVGYGTYAVLLIFNFNYLIANTISTIIGIVHSYIWNRKFTFKSKKSVSKELYKFVLVYLVSYILGMINISILVSKMNLNEYLAGIFNLLLTTLISWFGHKYFSFKEDER